MSAELERLAADAAHRAIFSVSYYHFYRGGFLTQNQPASQDVDYFSAWLTYKF
jgi:hypothetical protein